MDSNRFRPTLRGAAAAWVLFLFMGVGRVYGDCESQGFILPFNDLGGTPFCAQIAEAYFSGLTNGTTPTTYAPINNVPRQQMAAFVTRTLDQSLLRGNRRAALDQWWTQTPLYDKSLGLSAVGLGPVLLKSDGADIWVANNTSETVSRVRASDGALLGTWMAAKNAYGVLVAMGKVFVAGEGAPGHLYMIDPASPPGGAVTQVATLGLNVRGIAFDGSKIWVATAGSVSIVTPGSWSVSVVPGFTGPVGFIFDGTHMWVTDGPSGSLLKLDSEGAILQTVAVGTNPTFPAFDGHNIWVPNSGDSSLTVVRAADGVILKTFGAATGNQNGLNTPIQAAFDGERVLVTNGALAGPLSLFKATDLSIIGNFALPDTSTPWGACSDGINFWVSLLGLNEIGRF